MRQTLPNRPGRDYTPGMSDNATRQFCRLGWSALIGAGLFGIFIFPTPYEYQTLRTVGFYNGRLSAARPREILYRVNRITGSAEKIVESTDRDGVPAW